jgi:hypothetical protein
MAEQQMSVLGQAGSPQLNGDTGRRDAIGSELKEIQSRAELNAKSQRKRASRWSSLYFLVGLPAAVLAAVSGATALASTANHVAAGVIALIAAGLTASAAFLDSGTRRRAHENLAAGWQVLANDVHVRLVVDLRDDLWLERYGRMQLQDLLDRERKLVQGKAPDAEAEAERRAQAEAVRAQEEAARAVAEAERARAAEQLAQAQTRKAILLASRLPPESAREVFARIDAAEAAEPG